MKAQKQNVTGKSSTRKKLEAAGWTLIALTLFGGCAKGKIEMTEEERAISEVPAGGGLMRLNGRLRLMLPADFQRIARENGYSSDATDSSQTIAKQTNSIVALSESSQAMGQNFADMLAHIKGKLNSSTADLEVAFTIDYSGSMSDDIQGTVNGMVTITESLKRCRRPAVKSASGSYRSGWKGARRSTSTSPTRWIR